MRGDASREEQTSQDEAPSAEERARGYDDDVRTAIPGYELLHETAAALLTNELGAEARLLVVGAGTGEEIIRLAADHPGWRLVGEDPSAAMLAVAREKVFNAGLSDRVVLVEGSLDDVPADDPFDAATLLLVHHFLPDDGAKLAMLRAVAARLKPGAPLIVASMHGDLASPATRRLYQAWQARQIARGTPPADAEAMFQGLPTVVHFVSEERTRELLAEAGFVDVEPVFRAFVIGGWLARRGDSGSRSK